MSSNLKYGNHESQLMWNMLISAQSEYLILDVF